MSQEFAWEPDEYIPTALRGLSPRKVLKQRGSFVCAHEQVPDSYAVFAGPTISLVEVLEVVPMANYRNPVIMRYNLAGGSILYRWRWQTNRWVKEKP